MFKMFFMIIPVIVSLLVTPYSGKKVSVSPYSLSEAEEYVTDTWIWCKDTEIFKSISVGQTTVGTASWGELTIKPDGSWNLYDMDGFRLIENYSGDTTNLFRYHGAYYDGTRGASEGNKGTYSIEIEDENEFLIVLNLHEDGYRSEHTDEYIGAKDYTVKVQKTNDDKLTIAYSDHPWLTTDKVLQKESTARERK